MLYHPISLLSVMRNVYPSDITRKQFEFILPLLEKTRKTTKPRIIDLYEVFCALLYLLKSGCQWRMIPHDFPKWRTVYSYFQIKSLLQKNEPSILEQALKKVYEIRWEDSRKNKTIFIILAAQRVKNTHTTEQKGDDTGKKVSGITTSRGRYTRITPCYSANNSRCYRQERCIESFQKSL